MHRIQLSQDIRSLSEFRANVASFIDQVHKTNRPLIITNHGKSTAVLLNVEGYESLLDKLELLAEIQQAEKEIENGKTISHSLVKRQMGKKFKR